MAIYYHNSDPDVQKWGSINYNLRTVTPGRFKFTYYLSEDKAKIVLEAIIVLSEICDLGCTGGTTIEWWFSAVRTILATHTVMAYTLGDESRKASSLLFYLSFLATRIPGKVAESPSVKTMNAVVATIMRAGAKSISDTPIKRNVTIQV